MPANKKTSETAAASHSGQQQQQDSANSSRSSIAAALRLGSLGLDGAAGAKLVTTLLEQHPRKADRVTQVRKYLTTAGFKRASANSISRTIVAVVEGSLPPTSLKDKVDTSSDREPHQRHQQQMSARASDDLEFWSPSGEDSSHQPPDTPSPPRATTPPPRAKKVKPMKITGRDLTTMLGITQERSIQQYSDDEGHGGRVLTRHRKPLTTAPKGRAATGNLRPSSSSEFPRATMAGSMPRPAGVWADPTRSNDRSRSLSPELSEVYGTASRKGQVKLTGMQLLQVFDNARAQRKLKQDMAGRRLRNRADDGESSDDELNAAASSSANAFWQWPMEEPSPGSSVPGAMRTQRDKPRRLRGNKAHERPQDFEKLDTQLKEEQQETEDLFASLPAVPINDDDDAAAAADGGVYHAMSRKEKKKNAKKAAPSAKKEATKPEKSAPQLPVVASSDTMMLQLLAKHQAAEREEAERKKKAEEEERKRIEAEEEELRRQQEEEKARLEREGQWRKQREEAQQRQIELRKREEEQERKRKLEAAQKAEEEKRRMEIEKAVRREKEEMMRQKEQEEKERQEREEALQKQRDEELRKLKEAQEAARQSQLEADRLRKENEEREAQAAKEAESGKEQQEQAFERKEAALAAMQAAMEAREKEFEEKMKAMQERLHQLEVSKAESGGDNSQRNIQQQQQQQQQIIDRQLSVISASRSNTAKQQCITSMKHFLQRLSRQYDIHVDTTSWKKRLETEGEGAAPTWNWCDQLLVFRPLDSRGSKVLPTPMPASMDTDNCEVRITHVMLCTNYVGLVIGDVQIEGQENRERLAAGVIVCGRSGGLPGQSPVGTYRAIDVVRAALRRNKDTLDSDWTTQGVKEIKDLDVTPQSSLANQDHKHEDVYLQELDKPMLITAPRETITVKQRAPPARAGSQTTGTALPPWRRGTTAEELPWAAGPHRQQSSREPVTPSTLFRTGEKREYTDAQTHFDQEGRSYGLLEMLRFRTVREEPPEELKTMREVEGIGAAADRTKKEGEDANGRSPMGEGTPGGASSPSRPRAQQSAREAPWRSMAVPTKEAGFW